MEILWHSEEPLLASEIKDQNDELSIYTIQQVLKRLMNMGFVEVSGIGYNKKSIARKFKPAISEAQFIQNTVDEKIGREFTLNFVSQTKDKELINELQEIINQKKKELE